MIRLARRQDLPTLVRLLGQLNEAPSVPGPEHEAAFQAIDTDPRQQLLVVEVDGAVAGTLALIIVPNLGHHGRPWAMVENVVVDEPLRGRGLGATLMRHVMDEAQVAGCYKLVLTSRRQRESAHRFYARLGFEATSVGFRYTMLPD
ncbi:MAG: GNAT family N-acetyltransferase [Chloroflexi bacterium]|nr:GNAT family N-acetyltransferase [Chloroflexota bacterium]